MSGRVEYRPLSTRQFATVAAGAGRCRSRCARIAGSKPARRVVESPRSTKKWVGGYAADNCPGFGCSPERGCLAREPWIQAAAEPRAELLWQLRRRLHLPVADGGEAVEQFERREREFSPAAGQGLGEGVADRLIEAVPRELFTGEGAAGAVAQQSL